MKKEKFWKRGGFGEAGRNAEVTLCRPQGKLSTETRRGGLKGGEEEEKKLGEPEKGVGGAKKGAGETGGARGRGGLVDKATQWPRKI